MLGTYRSRRHAARAFLVGGTPAGRAPRTQPTDRFRTPVCGGLLTPADIVGEHSHPESTRPWWSTPWGAFGPRISEMNLEWATVVAGLGAAAIAGAVAIISTYLASRRADAESAATRLEAARNREHALLSLVMPKQLGAVETIWWCLYRAELKGKVSEEDLESIGRSLLWVTEPVRAICLRFLLVALGRSSQTDQTFGSALHAARQAILDLARVARLDEVLTTAMPMRETDDG